MYLFLLEYFEAQIKDIMDILSSHSDATSQNFLSLVKIQVHSLLVIDLHYRYLGLYP